MNTPEGKAWRVLSGTRGAGTKTLWMIADYLENQKKTASWLLQNPDKIQDVLYGSKASIVMSDFDDRKFAEVENPGGRLITVLHPLHPDFPQRIKVLKDIMPLPAILYARGNISILNKPAVAIVGKRNAGSAALAVADSIACELVAKGINVISGYAKGIDTATHLAALRAAGTTSIVLAEGIGHFQVKPELRELLSEENSLVISQFELHARWASYMAMTRNKLIGALSGAVVVVVSGPEQDANGKNSGTFNSGMSALKMDIPVFVVTPGFFPDDPEGNRGLIAKGCHAWDPAAGVAPILAAIGSTGEKKPHPEQRNLFEKIVS